MNIIKLLTFFIRIILLHWAVLINEVEQREPYICNVITDHHSEERTKFLLQHVEVRKGKKFLSL